MELSPEHELIHQPVRLRIMALLWKQRDISYTRARDHLGLTDGNLAAHAKKLQAADFMVARRVLQRDGFQVRYQITRTGAEAFRSYLAVMQSFLHESE